VSKNFELMQKAEQDQEIFLGSVNGNGNGNGSSNGHHKIHVADRVTREETVKLVQRLFLQAGASAPRQVLFSGIDRGDGCTSICARAAETLIALGEGPCCVVDANLRSPGVHKYFQLNNTRGLSDALMIGGPVKDFAQQIYGGNLWVMTSGATSSDPAVLLNSGALTARLAELQSEFAFVLIDAPPVNLFGDATNLGKLCDGAVLVLNSNSTRREAARKSKEIFEDAGVRVLGAILNRRTFPIPQSLYEKL
jgi:succinoglycan biosynthesis transport protein ExoP